MTPSNLFDPWAGLGLDLLLADLLADRLLARDYLFDHPHLLHGHDLLVHHWTLLVEGDFMLLLGKHRGIYSLAAVASAMGTLSIRISS